MPGSSSAAAGPGVSRNTAQQCTNANGTIVYANIHTLGEEDYGNSVSTEKIMSFLCGSNGVKGVGVSVSGGLALDVGISILYVTDDFGGKGISFTVGIGGGGGLSLGITEYNNSELSTIDELKGASTSVGGSIIAVGIEGDSSGGFSALEWKPSLGAEFHALITYTWVNGYINNNSLWKEILRIDLSEVLGNVKIPYILLQGNTDIVASTQTAKCLVSNCNNPNLRIQVVSNTGHMPGAEMIEALMRVLKETADEL